MNTAYKNVQDEAEPTRPTKKKVGRSPIGRTEEEMFEQAMNPDYPEI